jgi:ribonuclease HII
MLIAGVDEAGRGPLAGPVCTSAVILNPQHAIPGIIDSKQLTPSQREQLATKIRHHALAWAIGQASVAEIEKYNILGATLLAMKRAVDALSILPQQVLIDGQHSPVLSIPTKTLIKGDQFSPPISAASILAKVFRDKLMQKLHQEYPEYGFAKNKGYGTRQHLMALKQYGYTPVHRRSFAPVKQCIKRE